MSERPAMYLTEYMQFQLSILPELNAPKYWCDQLTALFAAIHAELYAKRKIANGTVDLINAVIELARIRKNEAITEGSVMLALRDSSDAEIAERFGAAYEERAEVCDEMTRLALNLCAYREDPQTWAPADTWDPAQNPPKDFRWSGRSLTDAEINR